MIIVVFWNSFLFIIVSLSILDTGKFSTETQGNYFRYIALQSLCADALRKTFDNLPDTFEEKLNKFKQKCHPLQKDSKLSKPLKRNVFKIYFFKPYIYNHVYITKYLIR